MPSQWMSLVLTTTVLICNIVPHQHLTSQTSANHVVPSHHTSSTPLHHQPRNRNANSYLSYLLLKMRDKGTKGTKNQIRKPNRSRIKIDEFSRDNLELRLPVRFGLVRFSSAKPVITPSPELLTRYINDYVSALNRTTDEEIKKSDDLHNTENNEVWNGIRENVPMTEHGKTDPFLRKRRYDGAEFAHDVCPSISDWVARTDAVDPYGNQLKVVQRIPINGTVVNQYFYETFCISRGVSANKPTSTGPKCRGIDSKNWNSRCKEHYIWTYGRVVTVTGEVGWSVIAIRGSCGCAIWEKEEELEVGHRRRLAKYTDPFLLK